MRTPAGDVSHRPDRPGQRPRRLPVRRRLVLVAGHQEEVDRTRAVRAAPARAARGSSTVDTSVAQRGRYPWLVAEAARATCAVRASHSGDRTRTQRVGRPDARSERARPVEIPNSITVKELAELLGVNPADIIRELIKSGIFASINQPLDRDTATLVTSELGYEVAEARATGDRPRRTARRPTPQATKEVLFEEDDASRSCAATADRDRHGPRRPRQDQPARRDPHDRRSRPASAAASPSTSAPARSSKDGRRIVFLDTPGPRGVHRHARPRRAGDRHRGARRRRRRRRDAPDARGDRPRPRGQGADRRRASTRSTRPTPTPIGSRPSCPSTA